MTTLKERLQKKADSHAAWEASDGVVGQPFAEIELLTQLIRAVEALEKISESRLGSPARFRALEALAEIEKGIGS